MSPIYHVTRRSDWEHALATGRFAPASLEREGFIHCARRGQLVGVGNDYFRGVRDLVLLQLDPERLDAEVRQENLHGGADRYPHVYGSIPCAAVVAVTPFAPRPDGSFGESALP